jgi:hypothetical protein
VTGGSCFPFNRVQRVIICDDGSCFPLNRVQRVLICDGWILFFVE